MKSKVKKAVALVLSLMSVAMMHVTAFAATTPDIDLAGMIGDGMTNIQGQLMGIIAVVVPVVLVIAGLILAIRKGLQIFRSLTRSA